MIFDDAALKRSREIKKYIPQRRISSSVKHARYNRRVRDDPLILNGPAIINTFDPYPASVSRRAVASVNQWR